MVVLKYSCECMHIIVGRFNIAIGLDRPETAYYMDKK